MPMFIRARQPGGTFFFTLVTHGRTPIFADDTNVDRLRTAFSIQRRQQPFELLAAVVLHDHLHIIMRLPEGDADFSSRIGRIKVLFTRSLPDEIRIAAAENPSRARHRESGIWQRRFWEHMIRDEADLIHHVEYIHFNPVKHGLAPCPHAWKYSSFHRFVARGFYDAQWGCRCDGCAADPPADPRLEGFAREDRGE